MSPPSAPARPIDVGLHPLLAIFLEILYYYR